MTLLWHFALVLGYSNSCRTFLLLKEIAKSKVKCIAIASQSNSDNFIFNFCYYFLEKENCNSWKIDNFLGSNREKSNIVIAILENGHLEETFKINVNEV